GFAEGMRQTQSGLTPYFDINAAGAAGGRRPINSGAFAGGTSSILPGWTPGRDVHRFYSPTAGVLGLSGGEGIGRPEFVAALGHSRWNAMNYAARTGGVEAVKRAMLPYLGGYALGASSMGGGGAQVVQVPVTSRHDYYSPIVVQRAYFKDGQDFRRNMG